MNALIYVVIALLAVVIILLLVLLLRKPPKNDSEEALKQLPLIDQKLDITARQNKESLNEMNAQMTAFTNKSYEQQIKLLETLNENTEKQTKVTAEAINGMQKSNEQKLDEMRKTVDEKLSETLNQRLNASFKTVSEQLQNVYKSLGEMKELSQSVTTGVTDLNRVLTNVKTRGTWAEVQLKNILDETIPGMYATNVRTNPNYNGQVEFAVLIPTEDEHSNIYLPIDSKFPMADYDRLSTAAQEGNVNEEAEARKSLERTVKAEARMVKQYLNAETTTPFAVIYLATEGLYAEITKSEIAEQLQSDGILIAGPTTITALLNSLAMGFKTIAINRKANEVWKMLGIAKAQYEKFGDLLTKARKKVEEAGKVLEEADHRNDIIQKKLKSVESITVNDDTLNDGTLLDD